MPFINLTSEHIKYRPNVMKIIYGTNEGSQKNSDYFEW